MSIGEVAKLACLPASTIRYYESIGLLPEVERIGGRRRYPPDILTLFMRIAAAKQAGLSLAEIRELLAASQTGTPVGKQLRAMAQRKLPEIDALIEHSKAIRDWLQAAATCECVTLDDCPLLMPKGCLPDGDADS
ncbi:MAG: MerR family transcriptional regulator [Actinomycetota bacterium]|nr:MerR family transcriptional regulator [Actinomycetota bacterium]